MADQPIPGEARALARAAMERAEAERRELALQEARQYADGGTEPAACRACERVEHLCSDRIERGRPVVAVRAVLAALDSQYAREVDLSALDTPPAAPPPGRDATRDAVRAELTRLADEWEKSDRPQRDDTAFWLRARLRELGGER